MTEPFDVLLSGTVFFDIVFTGFPHPPAPGTEVWTSGMGSSPGGIANLAVATARLGLTTGLVAGFSTDLYGDWMWETLSRQEGIDLSHSCRYADWHTPVTVSLAIDDDRSMVTHGHPTPECVGDRMGDPPPARAVFVDMGDPIMRDAPWWRTAADRGSLVFADAGWDPAQEWDRALLDGLAGVHAFTPNAEEAMGYTRTGSARAALHALTEHVPLAVVTDGARGVIAIDSSTGEEARAEALLVNAVDPTGAGDVFAAALAAGTVRGWPLEQRLRFGVLCSALAVQQFGGSLSAPGWGDVADWWHSVQAQAAAGIPGVDHTRAEYGFLADCLPGEALRAVRRAEATIAAFSDADLHHHPLPPRVIRD
ncbi:PfkB family carbohydrate kinase [Pseudactinotalea sp. HY158]|uniref:PfkB family carbohydrate kinase n=1 Tax=Pseudactinotalea sp. HY158 TaxID=2654547 RepID=UPI00129C949D|nr:PfkB family carbohydrate kinase [Pseudactinotalea sp. HY158]QGH69955.1 carbohydrate kinase family protein [Pseudactinotalea sp. HY158]